MLYVLCISIYLYTKIELEATTANIVLSKVSLQSLYFSRVVTHFIAFGTT
jgi:hypothetical protein